MFTIFYFIDVLNDGIIWFLILDKQVEGSQNDVIFNTGSKRWD